MKFISTDGRITKIDLRPSRWPRRSEDDSKSLFQYRVGKVVDLVFPEEIILEEFYIPTDRLYIDFYLPRKSLAVEAHGDQHFAYSQFFHGNKENYIRSQERDRRKSLWCATNEIRLVIIRESDTDEVIRSKLLTF